MPQNVDIVGQQYCDKYRQCLLYSFHLSSLLLILSHRQPSWQRSGEPAQQTQVQNLACLFRVSYMLQLLAIYKFLTENMSSLLVNFNTYLEKNIDLGYQLFIHNQPNLNTILDTFRICLSMYFGKSRLDFFMCALQELNLGESAVHTCLSQNTTCTAGPAVFCVNCTLLSNTARCPLEV